MKLSNFIFINYKTIGAFPPFIKTRLMGKLHALILLFICCFFSLVCFSQYSLSGNFQNLTEVKYQNLPSLQLSILQDGFVIKYELVSPKVKFKIINFTPGKYTLSAAGNYFAKWDTTFQIISSDIDNIVIPLLPLSKSLDTIRITSKRNPFFKRSDTLVFNAADYKRGNEKSLKDLINNLPGASVESGIIVVNGQVVQRLLLDGKDLTGADYSKIVNNLGVANVKELQLIQNYKDRFQLSYNLGDSILAMNITFKNKRSIITTARVGAGVGVPGKFYEGNADVLGDKKAFTFLLFANKNNHGNSLEQLTVSNGLYAAIFSSAQLRSRQVGSFLNAVREPYYLGIQKNAYVFNNTGLLDLSTEFRISATCKTKNIISFSPEAVNISKNSFSQSFIGNDIFATRQSDLNNAISGKQLVWKSETVKMLSNNSQVIFKLKQISNVKNANNTELVNGLNRSIVPENSLQLSSAIIEFNKLTSIKSRISLQFFAEVESTKEKLFSTGIPYLGVFLPIDSGAINTFMQSTIQKQNQLGFSFEYSKLVGSRAQLVASIRVKKSVGDFLNTLNVEAPNIKFFQVDSFSQRTLQKRVVISPSISFVKWIYNWYLSTTLSPVLLPLQQQGSYIEKNKFYCNGNFKLSRSFDKFRTGFSIDKIVDLPNNEYLPDATIVGFGNIYKAPTAFFANQKSIQFDVFLRSNNMQGFSSKYNITLTYARENKNYIPTPLANNFYAIESVLFLPNKTDRYNITIGSFFKWNKGNLVYEPNLDYTITNRPFFQNGIFLSSISKSWNYKQLIKRVGLHKLNFSLVNNIQKTVFSSESKTLYKVFNSFTQFTVDIMVKQKYFLVSQIQHVYNKLSATQKGQEFYFVNIGATYRPSSKIGFSFDWRNVLNSNNYILQNTSPTFRSIEKTRLIPSHIFLKMDYNF
jgi:hypothetical protein